MCGRYGFSVKDEREFLDRFEIETVNFELQKDYANWNVAPTQEMPVIERHSPNGLYKKTFGFFPSWSPRILFNAQKAKLDTSRVWKNAFESSRCIVPASYFFEWKVLSKNEKQPYLIRLKSKEMFGFAGLTFKYADKGQEKEGFVIITTEPNSLMEKIHNRMPVILKKEDEDEWLNPDIVEPEKLKQLLKQYHPEEMEAYPVSSLVNKPANNFPEITKPIPTE